MSSRLPGRAQLFTAAITISLLSATCLPHCFGNSAKVDTTPTGNAKQAGSQYNKYRLPKNAIPSDYELSFEPNLSKFTFTGSESVKMQVLSATKEIEMNALELKISAAQIIPAGAAANSSAARDLEIKLEPETQKVRFIAKEPIAPGAYELKCKFEGTLNNQLRGFYRSGYTDESGNKAWLAATQMEPTDARRMFPAFDEPAYKAVFRIKAIINKNFVAISNAPVEHEETTADKKIVTFEASPKMSTYLMALVIGDLKCTGETRGANVPIRVWAVSGKEHLGKYALSEAGKILDYQAKYFGVPYLGKKLDLIALPEFSAGAMENIGAITYHDSELLLDEKTGSSFQKESIFGTTAHEMAHQWFGDLVTMAWWDDLWLNESFATWMCTKVEDALHPEWRTMTEAIFSRIGAMHTDSLKATRAIHADVNDPSQANEMFDGITYAKGAAVLKMLETFVGEQAFQNGISKYLKEHSFANSEAQNFWNAIAAESKGVPVAEIMHSYVYQAGYPQVNAKFSADNKEVKLSQYRHLRLGQDLKDPSIWQVPIVRRELSGANSSATDKSSNSKSELLTKRTQDFSLNGSSKPVYLNAGGNGYYNTCYEPKQLRQLRDAFQQLSTEEKIVLINDCKELVLSGDVPIEDLFDFSNKIKDETDPMVLNDLVGFVGAPHHFVMDDPATLKAYERWVCHVMQPIKTKLDGWNQKATDSQQTKSLRSEALDYLGTIGQDKKTIGEAFFMFGKYVNDRTTINPDLVSTMLSIVSYNGGAKEYDQMMQLWKTAKNPADQEKVFYELGTFRQAALAKRTIAFCMGKEVKLQEGIALLCEVARSRYTRDIGWAFIKQNWNQIMHRFPEGSLTDLCSLSRAYDSADKEKEFRAWFAGHPVPFGKAPTARALESTHISVLYRQRYEQRIRQWVLKQAASIPKK